MNTEFDGQDADRLKPSRSACELLASIGYRGIDAESVFYSDLLAMLRYWLWLSRRRKVSEEELAHWTFRAWFLVHVVHQVPIDTSDSIRRNKYFALVKTALFRWLSNERRDRDRRIEAGFCEVATDPSQLDLSSDTSFTLGTLVDETMELREAIASLAQPMRGALEGWVEYDGDLHRVADKLSLPISELKIVLRHARDSLRRRLGERTPNDT